MTSTPGDPSPRELDAAPEKAVATAAQSPSLEASMPSAGQQLLRIAFVDDEPSLVTLARRALPLFGCAPTAWADPLETLAAITADPSGFDVLITDHAMPNLSGIELALRARALAPTLPILMTSGYLTTAQRQAATDAGVGVIVSKPCTFETLAAAAHQLVNSPE